MRRLEDVLLPAQCDIDQVRDLVFGGSECTGGEAQAVVTVTGMGTGLGRIAALGQRVGREESPLEHQVKRVAWLIALVAVGAGIANVPEVMPFLIFALAGGTVPLPLTVMQILAIDLGTDTLPALALSREPAEPGLMDRPPRPSKQGVISAGMSARRVRRC